MATLQKQSNKIGKGKHFFYLLKSKQFETYEYVSKYPGKDMASKYKKYMKDMKKTIDEYNDIPKILYEKGYSLAEFGRVLSGLGIYKDWQYYYKFNRIKTDKINHDKFVRVKEVIRIARNIKKAKAIKGEKMLSNMQLYGTNDVPVVPKEVVDKRVELLMRHKLEILNKEPLKGEDVYTLNKIESAIEFWKRLGGE